MGGLCLYIKLVPIIAICKWMEYRKEFLTRGYLVVCLTPKTKGLTIRKLGTKGPTKIYSFRYKTTMRDTV
jgi:hypothetical protein